MDKSEKLEYWHNKGEQDAVEGKGYREPWDGPMSVSGLNSDEHIAQNKAYKQGWQNAKKRKR
jgi:hypothetical protein